MKVILENIQSIRQAEYDMTDTGFVKICGGNSNGKSILIKTIGAIVSLDILDAECRRALINDRCDEGLVEIQYKGKTLFVQLNVERNKCLVCLKRVDGTKIVRTFREGGIEELIHEFGFRVYNKNNICLQVHETFGAMPFVNTSTAINGEIVEAVTEDTIAKDFLMKFKEVTHKKAKELVTALNTKIVKWQSVKNTLTIFDYVQYSEKADAMRSYEDDLKYLDYIELPELEVPKVLDVIDFPNFNFTAISIPPEVTIIDIPKMELPECGQVELFTIPTDLRSIEGAIVSYLDACGGMCPTCGRKFVEDEV